MGKTRPRKIQYFEEAAPGSEPNFIPALFPSQHQPSWYLEHEWPISSMLATLQYWTDDDLQQPKGVEEIREGREGILSDLLCATDNQKSLLTAN